MDSFDDYYEDYLYSFNDFGDPWIEYCDDWTEYVENWTECGSNRDVPTDEKSLENCKPDCHTDTLKFCEKLNTLRSNEKYYDMVIQVEDETFFCHKIILAASSEYFEGMIGGNFQESKLDRISLDMVSAKVFETILSFMYSRQIDIQDENATDLLMASDFLGIQLVKELCFEYIWNNYQTLPIDNVIEILQFTLNISEHKPIFIGKLFKYLAVNFSVFFQSSLFTEVSYTVVNSMLQLLDFEVNGDEIVEAIIRWVKYKLDDRKVHLLEMIEMIKFGTTDASYLKVLVQFAADCNETEVISNSQLIPSTSNAVSQSISSLHVYFSYQSPVYCSSYLGMLALDHKSEWKCYSRKSVVQFTHGKETKNMPPDLAFNDSRRTVSGESLYHLQNSSKESYFFRSDVMNLNRKIRLKNPPLIDKTPRLCSTQDKVYLHYGGPHRNRFHGVIDNSDELTGNIFVYQGEPDKWFSVPLPPGNTENSFLVTCNNTLYLLGASAEGGSSEAYRYDSRTPKWQSLSSMCYKNPSPVACECNGKIYVCSGNTYRVEYYNPVANKWERLARIKKMSNEASKGVSSNSNQWYPELASHNNLVWVLDNKYKSFSKVNEACDRIGVEVYNPKTNIWSNFKSPEVAMRGLGDDKSGFYRLMDFTNITSS